MRILRIKPYAILVLAFVFASIVSFSISPQSPLFSNPIPEYESDISENINVLPSPSPISSLPEKVLGVKTTVVSKTSTPTPTPKPKPITLSNEIADSSIIKNEVLQPTPIPTPIPTPASTPTATPQAVVSNVNLEIKTPETSLSFSVEINEGMNVCDIMQKARDEGKINSITFDDSYLSAYKSKYVLEINGFLNNWTFTVNGESPLGCSLSNPEPNDTIVWKFL